MKDEAGPLWLLLDNLLDSLPVWPWIVAFAILVLAILAGIGIAIRRNPKVPPR
jgi:hypothetical protein